MQVHLDIVRQLQEIITFLAKLVYDRGMMFLDSGLRKVLKEFYRKNKIFK